METPYTGRAVITDNLGEVEIRIPARKNGAIVIFLSVWLCGWFGGETMVLGTLVRALIKGSAGAGIATPFMLFWLCGWTVGGFVVFRLWLWMLKGEEVITAGQGQLTITRKGLLFDKPKTYDLNEVKNLRVQDSGINAYGLGRTRGYSLTNNNIGTICFDYGMKTIKFGSAIDEAEGRAIINKLAGKKILTAANFETKTPVF